MANDEWAVEIEPSALSLTVWPSGSGMVEVSHGEAHHAVSDLRTSARAASWRWDDAYEIECALAGPDLDIRVTAGAPGELTILNQPGSSSGKGMMLPIAEGYYVPSDDPTWRAALDGDERSANEGLSLPLWGLDHGDFTLHWLLINPYNNTLNFKAEGDRLAVGLNHQFTRLAPSTPLTVKLHLAGADLLAGAKRYRRHLIEQGSFRSLADKIAATPSAENLLGATHLYLWDNGLLGVSGVRDWPALLDRLRNAAGLPEQMRSRFDPDTVELIRSAPLDPPAHMRRTIVNAVNSALNDLARKEWQDDEADAQAIVATHRALREEAKAAFGEGLMSDPAQWGSSLSAEVFDRLKSAGLERLWIGLGDGWEGGLWHPEGIHAATAHYLIAPYDGYETAIRPSERPDWTTAQLGRRVYEDCGVIKADGTVTAGFQRTGRSANSRCVAPVLKARIPPLASAAGYNSWFLDVYATGMVFDDYRPGATMTMAENSVANIASMRWVSEVLQLPVGSEGADAINAAGTIFAHGMETPLFGWIDAELRRQSDSPFFLGGWYPPEAPDVFFKPVPLKEPYRTLYFDPRTRLPLYQAVFHDAVIVTHHWSFDQLKLANVANDRALLQQLYNVPALFHISAETLGARLSAIRRHDAFFRPLHQRLWQHALVQFEWLSEDGRLQRTTFSDGTQLVANFTAVPQLVDGVSLPPLSVTAIAGGRAAAVFQV